MNRRAIAFTGLLLLNVCAGAAQPSADPQVSVTIARQPMADALTELGRQAGIQVVIDSALAKGMTAPAVSGTLTLDQAMQALLKDTGLRYERVDERTIAVVNAKDVAATSAVVGMESGDVRVAQGREQGAQELPAAASGEDARREKSGDSAEENKKEGVAEVVVTGSHIRGQAAPVGSDLVVVDRKYIERSGYSTLQDVLNSLPQAAPGPKANNPAGGDANVTRIQGNYGASSGFNLHGLGAGATLILVDGRRQAGTGTDAAFVDVSNIPLSLIDRIEILPDGASAIYGSDAISGVVNIVLKKDFAGNESKVRFGSKSGDGNELTFSHLSGLGWETGNLLVGLEYMNRQALGAEDRSYAANGDHRSQGGQNFNSLLANPGNIFDLNTGQFAYAIPKNQSGVGLTVGQLIPILPDLSNANIANTNAGGVLLPKDESKSAYLHLAQSVGRVRMIANLRFNDRPASTTQPYQSVFAFVGPNNPYYVDAFGNQAPYYVFYDIGQGIPNHVSADTKTYDGSLIAELSLSRDWRVGMAVSLSRQVLRFEGVRLDGVILDEALGNFFDSNNPGSLDNPATAYNPLVDGFLNVFGDGDHNDARVLRALQSELSVQSTWMVVNTSLTADGPLFRLPAGQAHLAVGAERKSETGDARLDTISSDDYRQENDAIFAELLLPVTGQAYSFKGAGEISLSFSGRYEDFGRVGHSLNPRIGVSWKPVPSLKFRGTWGRSFKVPSLSERDSVAFHRTSLSGGELPDPACGPGCFSRVLAIIGGVNPDLHEERARSWTFGLDFSPQWLAGFDASISYYKTVYQDKVGSVPIDESVLLQEDIWRDVIVRNPTPAEVAAVCESALPGDRPAVCNAPGLVAVIIDGSTRNIARQVNSGLDMRILKRFALSTGEFEVSFNGNYTFKNLTQLTETSPSANFLDRVNRPLSKRFRGGAAWKTTDISIYGSINYVPGYSDPGGGVTGAERLPVDSWITADVGVSYEMTRRQWLGDSTLTLNIVNVTNERPPFANMVFGYDTANADPYGRFFSLQVRKGW